MNVNISRLEKYILYDFGLYTFGSEPSAKKYFKVYLIRKYAPYFHDERLRATECEADVTK